MSLDAAATWGAWIFLVIFVMAALLLLASLPGWIQIAAYYKKHLFTVLLVAVVGCVVTFVGDVFKSYLSAQRQPLATLLASPEFGWDAQYAENAWRTRFRFEPAAGGKLKVVGTTYVVNRGGDHPPAVIAWESTEPFTVPTGATSVTFNARRTWTQDVAEVFPSMREEAGKSTDVQITLQVGVMLHGSSRDRTSAQMWGLVLTPAYPR